LGGHPGVLGVTAVVGDTDIEAGGNDFVARLKARSLLR
jgi:hypothetical protein